MGEEIEVINYDINLLSPHPLLPLLTVLLNKFIHPLISLP
jgi:hypothetical protein